MDQETSANGQVQQTTGRPQAQSPTRETSTSSSSSLSWLSFTPPGSSDLDIHHDGNAGVRSAPSSRSVDEPSNCADARRDPDAGQTSEVASGAGVWENPELGNTTWWEVPHTGRPTGAGTRDDPGADDSSDVFDGTSASEEDSALYEICPSDCQGSISPEERRKISIGRTINGIHEHRWMMVERWAWDKLTSTPQLQQTSAGPTKEESDAKTGSIACLILCFLLLLLSLFLAPILGNMVTVPATSTYRAGLLLLFFQTLVVVRWLLYYYTWGSKWHFRTSTTDVEAWRCQTSFAAPDGCDGNTKKFFILQFFVLRSIIVMGFLMWALITMESVSEEQWHAMLIIAPAVPFVDVVSMLLAVISQIENEAQYDRTHW